MKKVKKFAWFPTEVIVEQYDEIEIFETIWLKNYYQYFELKGFYDGDPSNGGVDWIEKYLPTIKKTFL